MKKSFLLLAAIVFGFGLRAQDCGPFNFRSYNIADSTGATGAGVDTFQLSQNYPAELTKSVSGGYAWDKVDFQKAPMLYMKSVLDYCWEGMDSANFVAQNNPIRKWYHAPMLDQGYAGREFSRGLVMDRTSIAGDLSVKQDKKVRNYSITFYNQEAAYTFGQVWCDPNKPDASKAKFPVGSVWFKMVFTTADTSLVPSLFNPMEWEAFVESGVDQPMDPKTLRKVRLIEVDFGVRTDAKNAKNGWVFGVYTFEGHLTGSIKDKLVPVGLQWGNNPGLAPSKVREGEPVTETWINEKAYNPDMPQSSLIQKIGFGGRLQGPVGNHAASMMSEYMSAGWPEVATSLAPGSPMDSVMTYYENVPAATPFKSFQTSLDYNLELVAGFRNHAIANGDSLMAQDYADYLTEMLGFFPKVAGLDNAGEEEVIEYDQGLEGRNMFVFIGFIVLVVVMLGLLVWNFLKK